MAKAKAAEGEVIKPKAKKKDQAMTVRSADTAIVAGVTTDQLKVALTTQTEQRNLIKSFIQDHLQDGVDFGKIHISKTCANKYEPENCKIDGHFSKAVLFKPGQEKIFSLFNLTNELERDDEALAMLEGTKGLVAYKCVVYRGDKKVGEGRGAAVVGDRGRDVNATIKIAEKRARMDACLSLGFSEYFAQDLDDPDYKDKITLQNERNKLDEEREAFNAPASQPERVTLYKRMLEKGFATKKQQLGLLQANGVDDPEKLTSGQAREMIRKLANNAYEIPDTVVEDIDEDDDIAGALEDAAADADKPAAPAEPELVVDDDLRSAVQERVEGMGLNSQGVMWFKKRAFGKPFAKWENLGDPEWIAAYNLQQAIEDDAVDVPDHMILGYVAPADDADQTEGDAEFSQEPLPIDPSEPIKNQRGPGNDNV